MPGTDHDTPAVGIILKHIYRSLNLVEFFLDPHGFDDVRGIPFKAYFFLFKVRKAPPHNGVYRTDMAVLVRPVIPYMAVLFITQPAYMVFSPQVPQQFQYNGAEINFLGGKKRKSFLKIHFI